MNLRQEIIKRFAWQHTEFATRQPSLDINLWGDILHNGIIIAESDLHNLHIDQLGTKLPTTWKIIKGDTNEKAN